MLEMKSKTMKMALKSLFVAGVMTASLFGSTAANALAVHPVDVAGLGLTVNPSDYFDSAYELKGDFGGLGDEDVIDAMNDSDWFGDLGIVQVGGANCSGAVSCSGGSGSYGGAPGTADDANLFVIHVGGGAGGGTVYAFLYTTLLNNFSISGFTNGVSFIRAYVAPSFLEEGPPEVPVPAALPLLLTGLAGLGLLGRSRRKSA